MMIFSLAMGELPSTVREVRGLASPPPKPTTVSFSLNRTHQSHVPANAMALAIGDTVALTLPPPERKRWTGQIDSWGCGIGRKCVDNPGQVEM